MTFGTWANAKRVGQATALLDFVQTLRTVDLDVLVLGDLNAYGEEDPIVTLTGGGMANLVARVPAADRYSYVFNGEAGYLDQALATGTLARQVAGVTVWHINADEPSGAGLQHRVQDAGPVRADAVPVVGPRSGGRGAAAGGEDGVPAMGRAIMARDRPSAGPIVRMASCEPTPAGTASWAPRGPST